MAKLNEQQQKAVDLHSNVNCLINAGAGSGKTATLSKRVYRLIHDKEVTPSSILILTFTNKAAYEMKQRIINQFAENDPTSLEAKEILSAHIQTFDSFSQYLVTKYAARLGISKKISVANDSILDAKRREFLHEILMEHYQNKDQALLDLLCRTDTKDDSNLSNIILDLQDRLTLLIPEKRNDLLENYDERRLSREFFSKAADQFVDQLKSKLIQGIYNAYFTQEFLDTEDERNENDLRLKIHSMRNIPEDYRNLSFIYPEANAVFESYLELLSLNGQEFLDKIQELKETERFTKKATYTKKLKEDYTKEQFDAFTKLKKLIGSKTPTISEIGRYDPSLEKNYQQLLSFKEGIHVILGIVKELDQRLLDYKKVTNSFTFSDISGMALALMTEPQYDDIAEEVSSRFTYIMVDEYQDTNDAQEEFLDSIRRHGHIFVVGDPKQSIYAFRNSNVKLFNAREEQFSKDSNSVVIPMNTNYRSVPKILTDINNIFLRYMTKDHGDIDYTNETQQLKYDKGVNLYPDTERKGFGISRIMIQGGKGWFENKKQEALAIIKDIQEKVNDPDFLIYDLSVGKSNKFLRRAKYSDFAILIRKKRNFGPYQELFNQAGIPLNNDLSTNLRDLNAIIFLESLIKAIGGELHLVRINRRHVFASLARSYVFGAEEGYDDEHIHDILTSEDGMDHDPIMEKIRGFCKRNLTRPFTAIFLDMLSSFSVISKLNLIGNAEDNISKIESLYQIILSQEQTGEGLAQFVSLFNDFRKYSLSLDCKTVLETENAVHLMTIHASKGLEFPIVYMPITDNCMSQETALGKPNYVFSKEFGILLPDYDLDTTGGEEENNQSNYAKTILNLVHKNSEGSNQSEIDEHVRLFYVALTRAKDSLIFVGNDNTQKENIYRMLDTTPHFPYWNQEYLKGMVSKDILTQEDVDTLFSKQRNLAACSELELTRADFPKDTKYGNEEYKAYQDFFKNEFLKVKRDDCLGFGEYLRQDIFKEYLAQILSGPLETKIRLYSMILYKDASITTLAEFVEKYRYTYIDPEDYEEEIRSELPEYIENTDFLGLLQDQSDADSRLNEFFRRMEEKDLDYFGIYCSQSDAKIPAKKMEKMADRFFYDFAFVLDGLDEPLFYERYPIIDEYQLKVFDSFDEDLGSDKEPIQLKDVRVDETHLSFPERIKRRASKQKKIPLAREDEQETQEETEERFLKDNGGTDDVASDFAMERGTYLHKLLELVDFRTKDTSFIHYDPLYPYMKPYDRELIDRILTLPVFQNLEKAQIYQEYDYYDNLYLTNGSIDLLIHNGDEFLIIDYKTSHIDDPEYLNQLKTYKRNVMEIFHASDEKVHTYLLSITKAELKQID